MELEDENRIEQYQLRYADTYITTAAGDPVMVRDITWDEDNEEIVFHVRKANNHMAALPAEELCFNPWGRHFTLYLPKWKGCLVVEKSNDVQIKRGVCTRSLSIVQDLRDESADIHGRGAWYDIVRAMQAPIYFDLGTAAAAMEEDPYILSMPISKNACMLRDGAVLYHGRIVGDAKTIETSKWWRLINKEAA